MTGVVCSGTETTLASGRIDGSYFHLDNVICKSGKDPLKGLRDVDLHGLGPVCISLLRNRFMVRHFRVPAESDAEIEAMLPHLLAEELPHSIELFSWTWVVLPSRELEKGFSQITVYVIRNDRIEEFLAPLADAGLNIVGLIPEGWSWAHLMQWVQGPEHLGDEFGVRSIIIKGAPGHLLIVERNGQLLFDTILPQSAFTESAILDSEHRTNSLDWDGPGFKVAREQFQTLLGSPLPRPGIWSVELQSDKNFNQDDFFFSASVAASGLARERLLIPPVLQRRIRLRTLRSALGSLVRLGVFAAVIWLVLAVFEDSQMRQHLVKLEQEIVASAPLLEGLEMEYNVIQENRKNRTDNTEILMVLECLRLQVKAPVNFAHLNYAHGRGVTLRGYAPTNSHVLEMTEQLSNDPLWQWLRVMQLQSEKRNGVYQVNFVIEGQLN